VFADQASKYAIRHAFALGESAPVVPGVFHITYHLNTGAAFGLFQGRTAALAAASLIFIVVTLCYVTRRPDGPLKFALFMVLGGAIGNAFDRVRLGYVVDFLDFRIWPIFNVADAAITCGVALILLTAFLRPRKTEKH
jgi:signal peptidase II